MTADETRVLVRRYLEAFNASDHEAMLALLAEDVAHDINQGGREIGKEKFRWFNAMMSRHYEETLGDIEIMVNESGSRAAAEFTVRGTYLATADGLPPANGQTYSLPAAILFEVDDGLISRVTTHYNLADWIAQVSDDR
ncbi:MAG: ketosteroid isomerase-related protein [Zhengella sp.]|uniref:ketosteroid isomerase-related protein n=1 Tax=Zhengella sp. TaxID=2282762 RepID=UPI001DFE61AF|nr:nuclear transport factor 2 family protein [Notoacmeibacter sp.]MCC0028624.1 nuclear transport factor 2 family protein [Brucellaceae bacterium]